MSAFSSNAERLPDGRFILSIRGELDLNTADDLRRALDVGIESGATTLVVDLTECDFLDSTTLRVLAQAHHHLNGRGARLTLVVPPGGTNRRIFEITELDRLFPVHSSLVSALGHSSTTDHQGAETSGATERPENA